MAEKLTLLEIDASTNVEVIRELTAAELAEHSTLEASEVARQSEQEAKIAIRTSALAKLAALGLTQDEIEAL